MTLYWKISLSVTLIAPWGIPGDEPAGSDSDVRLARSADGVFAIPGTHLKGHLRAAMEELEKEGHVAADRLRQLFGGESPQANPNWQASNKPDRGRLLFGELKQDTVNGAVSGDGFSVRVEIDPDRNAAREGHLLFVECPYQFGSEVTFSGEIIATGDAVPTADIALLKLAAARVSAIGGMKSVGFGRVKPGSWKFSPAQPVIPAIISGSPQRVVVKYSIDRPFLVNAVRSNGNLMRGADVVPGGAIKGALATAWAAAGYDAKDLTALSIGHAHPAKDTQNPEPRLPVPLSLSVADGKVFCHLEGDLPASDAHVFAADWKGERAEKVRQRLGLANPEPQLSGRSRTAIDRKTLGALYHADAEDAPTGETGGQLFSTISVRPDGHLWIGELSGDSAIVDKALGILKSGLPGLGKTGAVITCESQSPAPTRAVPAGPIDLCLLSDAALLDPAEIRNGATLEQAYARYFKAIDFDLENFFSRESLRGGYLALRYPPESGGYSPWLVTEPGTVFRVTPRAGANWGDILANGLPPATCYDKDWGKNPFLRENGYGAVMANVVDHGTLQNGVDLPEDRP